MFVIAGLGNPGIEYKNTRHNIGFDALDTLAEKLGTTIRDKRFSGLLGEGMIGTEKVVLVKPQTYMNLSGDCLQQIMHFYKLPPENLIVLVDDIELPLGSLRIRAKGSAGTHNGLKSIIACLNSDAFARIRIGCGQDRTLLLRDYVLKRPPKEERLILKESYENAAEAVSLIVSGDMNKAQALFNKRHEGPSGREEPAL